LKVSFDEHVPPALAKVFIAFAKERAIRRVSEGLVLERAVDYAPKPTDRDYIRKNDVPWIDRFAAAGGRAIISGDTKMRRRTHERLALYQHGFVVIFFEAQWGSWNFFRKTALMLHWWEAICDKIKNGDKGTFWAVPSAWPAKGGELRNVSLGLAQLLKDRPDSGPNRRPRRRAPSKPQSATQPQTDLFQNTERQRADKED
jgi:hypothetical protein